MYQKYRIKTNFIGLLVFVSCLSISLRSATGLKVQPGLYTPNPILFYR